LELIKELYYDARPNKSQDSFVYSLIIVELATCFDPAYIFGITIIFTKDKYNGSCPMTYITLKFFIELKFIDLKVLKMYIKTM